jgi:hypothetical protein
MLSPVSLTLIFEICLLIQILRLRHLREGVHSHEFKVMVPQHFIIGGVVIDTRFDIEFAYVH